jgi:hypothetical protein
MLASVVSKRILVDLVGLSLPHTTQEAVVVLERLGFRVLDIKLTELAQSCIGYSRFRRGARIGEAPHTVDCSSFVKWLYAQRGYWLPRRAIQQRIAGTYVPYGSVCEGDLVFVSGYIDRYESDPQDGVGHVGMVTHQGTVIHAGDRTAGVMEVSLEEFAPPTLFRGARRYVSDGAVTLGVPSKYDVETEDDVRWIILQSLV